jgi:hypothetical protein
MKRERLNPVEFYELEVLPTLFQHLDVAFPEFGWRRKGAGWVATCRQLTKSLTGARPDRVVCNQPWGFYVYGGAATSWATYINGGSKPERGAFVEVVRKLAALVGVNPSPIGREPTLGEQARIENQERRSLLFDVFLEYVRAALLSEIGVQARTYLLGRGFEESWLKELDLGLYTTLAAVRSRLAEAGFMIEEVKNSGVDFDARWEGRLVGAWRDRWGRIGTFWARDFSGRAQGAEKYLYLTSKVKWGGKRKADLVAFGLDVALTTDAGQEELPLVEGLLDVVFLRAKGFPALAAIGGSGEELSSEGRRPGDHRRKDRTLQNLRPHRASGELVESPGDA